MVPLLQLGVLGLRGDEDGDVGVGVFPECQEILVGGAGLHRVTLQGVGTPKLQMGQRSDGFAKHNPTMVEDFLKLQRGFTTSMSSEIRLSSNIGWVQDDRSGS